MWKVNLSVCLRAGRLAKGKMEWPLEVGFQGNTSQQSFYIQVRENSMDAAAFLESIADEDAGEYFKGCYLESAGLIYAHGSQGKPGTAMETPFPEAVELSELLQEKQEYMEKGACFWMAADLKELSVFSGALKIGYHGEQKLVMLGCLEKQDSLLNQLYYARLPEIELFHAIIFRHVRLLYQVIQKKSRFALAGEVRLSVGSFNLAFQGEIRINETGYEAKMSALKDGDVPVFALGENGKLQLDNLIFHLKCIYASETDVEKKNCYLETEIELAEQKWRGSLAYVSMEQKTCWHMELKLETDFSLSSLLGYIFGIGQSEKTLLDLVILAESGLSCDISEGSSESGGNRSGVYTLEFHTIFTLVINMTFKGSVKISPAEFYFSMQSEEMLDLEILQIRGAEEKGLTFSYTYQKEKTTSCMGIEGEFVFFGETLDVSVWYSGGKDDWSIRAELSPVGVLQTVFGAKLTVIYDKRTGFRLEELDAQSYVGEAFDFLKRMKEYLELLGKTNGCKKLQEELDKNDLQTYWSIRPGLEGVSGGDGRGIRLTLKGSLRVEDSSRKILLERHIGENSSLGITVCRQMTASELWEEITSLLQKTVDQIVEAVFEKENFQELEAIVAVIAEGEMESFVSGLLCRKLVSEEEAARLRPKKPSGGGEESGGESSGGEESGGESGGSGGESGGSGGGSGGSGTAAEGFTVFAAGGGAAFSSGEMGEWMAAGFIGVAAVVVISSGGGKNNPDEPLPCPEFRGTLDGAKLRIEIWQVEGAAGYELDMMWDGSGREDYFLTWKAEEAPPRISFLEIPVNGKLYLAVRALHKQKEKNSPWSEGNYLGEVTYRQLIPWAVQGGMCIRDCLQMLKNHQVDLEHTDAMKMVLDEYLQPADKEQVAQEHYGKHDSAQVCLEHLDRAFPHLYSGELMLCVWRAGYEEEEVLQALQKLRPALSAADIKEQFMERIREETKSMDLKTSFRKLVEQRAEGKLTEIGWQRALAELLVVHDPIEVALFLKELGRTAEEIALDLQGVISEHKAVTVGGIILNEKIYPETTREEMEAILKKAFSKEDIEKALGILYPAVVKVPAVEIWLNTGVTVAEDEIVNVRYLNGEWNVNVSAHPAFYGPEGIEITAKIGYALKGENEGCLVGKIGDGDAFYIGKGAVLPKGSGILFLITNDDINERYGRGYQDNRGEITVEIRKELR